MQINLVGKFFQGDARSSLVGFVLSAELKWILLILIPAF